MNPYPLRKFHPCSFISGQQTRIKTKKKTGKVQYDALVNTAKHQFGTLFYVMRAIEGSAEKTFERLVREGMPKRLNIAYMDYTNALPELEEEWVSADKAISLTFHNDLSGGRHGN